MKYLQLGDLFMPVGGTGEPFKINDVPATKAALIVQALKAYQPMDGGRTLTTLEIRSFNKALDILEGLPQEGGYYRFEDVDYMAVSYTHLTLPTTPYV